MSCITKTSAIILLGLLAHGGLLANESALSRTSAPTDSFHSFVSTTSEVSDHNPPIDPLTQARLGALRRRDAGSLPDVSGTEIAPAAVSSIVRRLVYHEIPMTTPAGVSGGDRLFAVSFNANRMAFFQYNPELNQNEIYVMNLDGSGIARVDSYTPTCYCNSQVDISADGSKILSWDGNLVLRLVNADGYNPRSVITIDGGYKYYRLSRDGSRVFFMVDRD
ncbi:MAG: TolB family protein, partial [Methylococcus sp.]